MDTSLQKSVPRLSVLDFCAIIFLAVCVFLLGAGALTEGCPWGDDFAAYILQGISIAEGNFDEQIKLNYLLHPSFMPQEASDGTLVYVWGYSLLLAIVYKLVGFDRVGYSSVIYYKYPTVIALALLAVVVYLFLRRRFGFRLSFFLTLLFAMSGEFFGFLNTMYSDLLFVFFAMLAIYLFELFLDAGGKKRIVLAVISGVAMWFMYEVRLNGVAVLLSCVIAHVIWCIKKYRQRELFISKKALIAELIPYVVFILLKFVSEAILAPATSNASDLQYTSLGTIYANIWNYLFMAKDWYSTAWKNILTAVISLGYVPRTETGFYHILNVLSYLSMGLSFIGIIFDGFKRNFHYTIFLGIYIFVASMLFYNQGVRYIYPLLPIFLMYTGYGFMRIVKLVRLPDKVKKVGSYALGVVLAFLCFCLIYPQFLQNREIQLMQGPDSAYPTVELSSQNNAYSSSAQEMYEYVKNNVPEDSIIGFFKPRALYLNTQRKGMALSFLLPNSLDDVDYYLIFNHALLDPKPREDFVTIWENPDFILMEKQGS